MVPLGSEAADEAVTRIRLHDANLDDLFTACGRRLGEGLHLDYLRRRADGGQTVEDAKRELLVLLADAALWQDMDAACRDRVAAWLATYQPKIKALAEDARQRYARIRQTARPPEPAPLSLPETITTRKAGTLWEKHVYIDAHGAFPCAVTGWEQPVLEWELRRPEVRAWLRNPPRKEWSFSVIYKDEYGDDANLYPDFLLVRDEGNGLIVDVVEPHRADEGDAARKLVGLAEYVDRHSDQVGRVLMIDKSDDGSFRQIDLNDETTRRAAKIVTTTSSVVGLFATYSRPVTSASA
ncbi:MAG: hypothetical protein ACRDJN_09890 [Chloroflexota bacterium]